MDAPAAAFFPSTVVSSAYSLDRIQSFYDRKTQVLLHRYGPGPRVHYHSGIVTEDYDPQSSFLSLKMVIYQAQEHLMVHLARVWDAFTNLNRDVVDIGCGLGGGTLFWAQEFGATVTAVTCAPTHIELVKQFAEEAQVANRVQPLLCNAVEIPGQNRFDAAVAIESSCHIPRRPLFNRLGSLIRRGGRIFIFDYFTEQQNIVELFHRHWEAPLGSLREYSHAAQDAGLQLESAHNLSTLIAPYWGLSAAFLTSEIHKHTPTSCEREKHQRSVAVHTNVGQWLRNQNVTAHALSFRKI